MTALFSPIQNSLNAFGSFQEVPLPPEASEQLTQQGASEHVQWIACDPHLTALASYTEYEDGSVDVDVEFPLTTPLSESLVSEAAADLIRLNAALPGSWTITLSDANRLVLVRRSKESAGSASAILDDFRESIFEGSRLSRRLRAQLGDMGFDTEVSEDRILNYLIGRLENVDEVEATAALQHGGGAVRAAASRRMADAGVLANRRMADADVFANRRMADAGSVLANRRMADADVFANRRMADAGEVFANRRMADTGEMFANRRMADTGEVFANRRMADAGGVFANRRMADTGEVFANRRMADVGGVFANRRMADAGNIADAVSNRRMADFGDIAANRRMAEIQFGDVRVRPLLSTLEATAGEVAASHRMADASAAANRRMADAADLAANRRMADATAASRRMADAKSRRMADAGAAANRRMADADVAANRRMADADLAANRRMADAGAASRRMADVGAAASRRMADQPSIDTTAVSAPLKRAKGQKASAKATGKRRR